MKKIGNFFITHAVIPANPLSKSALDFSAISYGDYPKDVVSIFYNKMPQRIAVFAIEENENPDDYELVKKVK
jgi:hypothetical protein